MDQTKDKAFKNVGDFSIRTICVRITMKGFPKTDTPRSFLLYTMKRWRYSDLLCYQ